ncbi:hypothetical protein CHLNCDRAFT_144903 [Chlorella variabilis]|uniref:Pentatricopeptide repeat-containing protein-mitochondrial domain-containing protein n=1 Tax=Chlorella variabilis TaxID=554065 RepID=E1ZD94_CHLVA|nr:hypothetical protein CHLNCDRAFT_144903 [Chlorella variabilis]EFN56379.1 hypothetical protein CHLNCDRAFT_144903 [Chlorella variabilis]|eukprot:XP_005848481.1 hypothetical protein CHLNCDRAFT_144903 [Chlorella variabilis]
MLLRNSRPPPRKPRIYVPQHWEQQGWEDLDLPLVRELRGHVDREDAWEAKHAFEAALAPLKEALQRGEDPRAAGLAVPPPYAWKLYFAVLAATNCHAHHMSELIELMVKLRPACYVIALRQMARQGIGSPAYTTILRMKDRGLTPTLRCFMFAIESCLRCTTPELTYVKRMFDEVAETGLAVHPTQKSELGKLMMHGVRELARFGRFDSALALLEQLEAMGLRVPAFLVADVLHMAVLAGRPKTLLECVRRLEQATSTFQEVPGVGEPVTRPLKVEEGLLLGALEVAAGRGDVELAEATWQLLERSVALPNPPSTGGALAKHLGQVAALERRQEAEEDAAAAAAAAAEAEASAALPDAAAGAAATPDAAGAEGGQEGLGGEAAAEPAACSKLEQWGEELEASDVAAAEAAEAAARRFRPDRSTPDSARLDAQAVREEAAAVAAQRRGMRPPSLLAHLAHIHAYAKAGQLEGLFGAVEAMQQAYPEEGGAASYHAGLPMAVDALAESEERCDAAFFLLEAWAQQERPVSATQLNLVVAACCQIGDLKRAFETFDAFEGLGVAPDADTYNALMQGCIETGDVGTAHRVHEQMQGAGVEANAHTHHQLVNAAVVAGDIAGMMESLEALEAAGHTPRLALLERCVARAERAGEREPVKQLLRRLFTNDYRIVGIDAKARWTALRSGCRVDAPARRWKPEGGMEMLTGSSSWFSREEVLREMRKDESISRRMTRRNFPQMQRSEQAAQRSAQAGQGHAQEQQQQVVQQ